MSCEKHYTTLSHKPRKLMFMLIDEAQAMLLEMKACLNDVDDLLVGQYSERLDDLYITYFMELDRSEVYQVIGSFEDDEGAVLPPIVKFDCRLRERFPKDEPVPIPRSITSSKRAARDALKEARAMLAQKKESA